VSAASEAARLIDLRKHKGVHPRIGALDVLPFVPLEGATLEDCVQLAHTAGQRIWDEAQVPSYFYEAAATRPGRLNLEDVRRGQFERLKEDALRNPARRPDVGGPGLHPTAGAVAVGARKFLIAVNVILNTPDATIAIAIAQKIRTSSGGLPNVKALGLALASRGLSQVSMNLTDYEVTPMHVVHQAIVDEAKARGVKVLESELIGLIPRGALEAAGTYDLRIGGFHEGMILENRLAEAARRGSRIEV
jgi:glutamate formiminotransferase